MKIIYPELSYGKALELSGLLLFNTGVFAWANLNDMAFNTSKTKSILITTQQKFHRLNDRSLDIIITGQSPDFTARRRRPNLHSNHRKSVSNNRQGN